MNERVTCVRLCDPMDCSLPGASVRGDSPGQSTEVGCHALLQGIFPTPVSCFAGGSFYPLETPGRPIGWVFLPTMRSGSRLVYIGWGARGLIATVAMGLSQFQDDRGADLHLCGLGTRLGGLRGSKVLRAAPGIARSIKI